MREPPSWDPVRGRLRLSPRQLGVLGGRSPASQADAETSSAQQLRAAGLLDGVGESPPMLRAVAAAAAGTQAQIAVTRVAHATAVRVGISWGESGMLVMRAAGADEVTDIVLQPPAHLARTVWRVLQLGPRPSAVDRREVEIGIDALLAPFAGRATGWTDTLQLDPAAIVLDRLDVVADALRSPASWAILDGGTAGLWHVTGANRPGLITLAPTSPAAAYAAIAALQPTPGVA